MKARKKARSREQDVPDRDNGCVDRSAGESREGSPDVSVRFQGRVGKRRCTSATSSGAQSKTVHPGPSRNTSRRCTRWTRPLPQGWHQRNARPRQKQSDSRCQTPRPGRAVCNILPCLPRRHLQHPPHLFLAPKRPGIIFSIRRSRVGRSTWRR